MTLGLALGIIAGLVALGGTLTGFVVWQGAQLKSMRKKVSDLYGNKLELEIRKIHLEHAVAERDRGLVTVHAEVRRQRNAAEAAEEMLKNTISVDTPHSMARSVAHALSLLRPKGAP